MTTKIVAQFVLSQLAVDNAVEALANAYQAGDKAFLVHLDATAKAAGKVGEARWLKDFAPRYKKALTAKFDKGTASVLLSRVKIRLIGVSNGIKPSPKTATSLRGYEAEARPVIQKKGLVAVTGKGRPPKTPIVPATPTASTTPTPTPGTSPMPPKLSLVKDKQVTASQQLEAAAFLLGDAKQAARFVTVLTSHREQLSKFLATFDA